MLYRGSTQIAVLSYDKRSYFDTEYRNEQEETYTLYYVSNEWDINTKKSEASISRTVNCTRTMPVNNFVAEGYESYIELAWTSDAYPKDFGHKFNIYVGNESEPVYTIIPEDYQTSFRWQHRSKAEAGRESGVDEGIPYTAEPLNGCKPHDYRVEGVIGEVTLNEASASKKAIGLGTAFESFEADKGSAAGSVKLSWQVNQRQETNSSKTYIIDRRLAEKAGDAWVTIHRMSSAEEYVMYTDETPMPGVFYEYRITVQDKCNDGTVLENQISNIGFSHATGTVSGRITYGTTGTAVAGVDVVALKSDATSDDQEQYHSMHFTNDRGDVEWQYPSASYQAGLLGGDFSIQLWIYPEQLQNTAFLYLADNNRFVMTSQGGLSFIGGDTYTPISYPFEGLHIAPEVYSLVTFTRSGSTLTAYVVTMDENGNFVLDKATQTLSTNLVPIANPGEADSMNDFMRMGYFKGYADEFRLWKKCLSEEEIRENFDHLLVGNEKNLETYWTFDEGLRYQFFDYSRDGTVYHQHHGKVGNNAESSTLTPSALALKAKTDKDGNYIIRGIPFSGDGSTYSIVPTYGIHQFNPTQQLRFVGNSSLVHNSVDFDDVSSFRVRGVAYYEHTTIPVQGAYIYVDGAAASHDGEAVKTNDYGEFEVSVPIGDHFISIKQQGHTFLNDGRYPADPDGVGVRHTFDREISGLTFYDQTKVTVVGRVVGGDIEHEKPIGLGVSQATIGEAKIELHLSNENGYLNAVESDPGSTAVSYDISSDTLRYTTTYGRAYVPANKNYIVVETDPITGEWVAQLLPLRYDMTDIKIPSRPENDMISKDDFSLPVIDATNPMAVYADSVEEESGEWRRIEFVASAKMEYKTTSVIDVTEHKNGAYGTDFITIKDLNGIEHQVPLYTVDNEGVHYTFGHPVYEVMGTHTYTLYAHERYVNYDGAEPVVSEVPLAGKNVTVKNQFASTTAVSIKTDSTELGEKFKTMDEELTLDEDGKALYRFQVGFPNIQHPYTRSLAISYDNNGTQMSWSGNDTFRAIVLGGLPTGTNFVTQGPDAVMMVLRDPPGSNSKTTWSQGTTLTQTHSVSQSFQDVTGNEGTLSCGLTVETAGGAPGFMTINKVETDVDIKEGLSYTFKLEDSDTKTISVTTTRDISTSDSHEFTGSWGDVFIGNSSNLLFGLELSVDVVWDVNGDSAKLVRDTVVSVGEEFSTFFALDQFYIRSKLLPDYIKLRNNLLKHVDNIDAVARPAKGEDPLYVTTLSPDDPRYGTSNSDATVWGDAAVTTTLVEDGRCVGPSYTVVLPEGYGEQKGSFQDMVNFYNAQVSQWEQILANNEQQKVEAIEKREATGEDKRFKQNYSFSAGTTIHEGVTKQTSRSSATSYSNSLKVFCGTELSHKYNNVGLGIKMSTENSLAWTSGEASSESTVEAMSFTLRDGDWEDYFTVDVYDWDGNMFSPIYVTRGGATSCPYEDEDKTVYYKPGTPISGKTMQMEKPEIEMQVPVITGVPAGGTATFKVNLRNLCEIDSRSSFDIKVTSGSNPDGLAIKMDDASLNKGTSVMLSPTTTLVKTITVSQTNPAVLDYENIMIRISSQCQNQPEFPRGEIADTASFSVYFQPSCSDIILESSHTLVNTDTEEPMTLSMSGYNYSMSTLVGARLQYKGENDADFRTLQEYTKDEARAEADPNLEYLIPLEGTTKLNYTLDLRSTDFSDKTYVFRAVTVCDQGGKEVTNESEEIRVIRDMSRPQLIATPSPASGVLSGAEDILITFNEDIQGSSLTKPNNFDVTGVLNESEVAHDVALNMPAESAVKTDATIDLGGKSFAFSMWLKYNADGTLLTHGTADHAFTLAIESQNLTVSVGDTKRYSTLSLPTDKWIYLLVSYDAENRSVTAGYAQDDFTKILLDNVAMPAYEGNGALALGGKGIIAQVQELALWDGARSMTEAQRTMYTTKSHYTHGLTGYWPFNEGHGTMAADLARSRHITLPSANTWWIEGDNYALTLDGTHAATINIGEINTTDEEDYLIEAWFMADKAQTGAGSILATDRMDLRIDANGYLEIEINEATVEILRRDLRDGLWHHLAVNVLKSTNGSSIIYLDGEPCKQLAASAMPVLHGSTLRLGQDLQGAVDEIRIWKARRTANVIKDARYARMTGDEAGLVAYYPLERKYLDEYNQIADSATLDDLLSKNKLSAAGLALSHLNTAPLKQTPRKENVQFSFVTSERQVRIMLDEEPAKIEGCTISLSVKRVKDIHGNEAQPVTWGVYVQQNTLNWQDDELTVTKTGTQAVSFSAAMENRGSQSEAWSISGIPSWLSVNAEGGVAMPLSSATLTFTVDESLAVGTYETVVYLTGAQGIAAPLTITVISEGKAPEWTALPDESTMTIIGVLHIDGIQSSDPKDMIAAFRGTECVGVAHPQYFSRYDSYLVLLTIYGQEEAALSYKLYDAGTGTVYPSVSVSNEQAYTYTSDKNLGSFAQPVIFTPLNEIEQDLSHDRASWRWFSLHAQPKVNEPAAVFSDAKDAIAIITDGANTVIEWMGTLESFAYDKAYKLLATAPYKETLVGEPTDPTQIDITLHANGWTWIGYPAQATNSLDAALADADPMEGDILKNQSAFAYYTEGKWMGTLHSMTPGEGYMYNSGAMTDKIFRYPVPVMNGRAKAPMKAPAADEQQAAANGYRDNMTMIAVVMDGTEVVEDALISVYAAGELRGYSAQATLDGRHFLTIGGEAGDEQPLSFVVTLTNGKIVQVPTQINFKADTHYGSVLDAIVLQIGAPTGIDNTNADIKAEKILYRGHLYILRSGKTYTATGQEVK